jgi:hypothetical protein
MPEWQSGPIKIAIAFVVIVAVLATAVSFKQSWPTLDKDGNSYILGWKCFHPKQVGRYCRWVGFPSKPRQLAQP